MRNTKEYKTLAEATDFIKSQGFHIMTREDIPKFAETSAEAYANASYPLINYFVGHPCTVDESLAMWTFNLKCLHSKALIYSDSPEGNAWLLWIPPGFKGFTIKEFLMNGGIKMMAKIGLGSMRRIMHYEDYNLSVRMQATGGREWYLYNVATHPDAQGKHLISRLIAPMLDYCASKKTPAYLETHLAKNVDIYRHFGFDLVSENPIPGTPFTHWGMAKPATDNC